MSNQSSVPTPEVLSAYLDGQLTDSERAELEKHLTENLHLQAELQSLQETVALLRSLPTLKAPRDFTLDPSLYRPKVITPRKWAWHLGTIGAVAAALVLVFAVFLMRGRQDDARESSALNEADQVAQARDTDFQTQAVLAPTATEFGLDFAASPSATQQPSPQPTASSLPTTELFEAAEEETTSEQGSDTSTTMDDENGFVPPAASTFLPATAQAGQPSLALTLTVIVGEADIATEFSDNVERRFTMTAAAITGQAFPSSANAYEVTPTPVPVLETTDRAFAPSPTLFSMSLESINWLIDFVYRLLRLIMLP